MYALDAWVEIIHIVNPYNIEIRLVIGLGAALNCAIALAQENKHFYNILVFSKDELTLPLNLDSFFEKWLDTLSSIHSWISMNFLFELSLELQFYTN